MLPTWEHYSSIPPVRVLGLVARGPVTLGHALLLHEAKSPFITGEPIQWGDLANAILFCCGTVKVARQGMRSMFRDLGIKVWGSLTGKVDINREGERFNEWFHAHCATPVAWKKGPSSGKHSAAPWPIQLLAVAMSDLGMTKEQAEAMSVRELNQLVCASLESRGEAEFRTDREQRLIDWLKVNEIPARN
jgi:hypothetical protein